MALPQTGLGVGFPLEPHEYATWRHAVKCKAIFGGRFCPKQLTVSGSNNEGKPQKVHPSSRISKATAFKCCNIETRNRDGERDKLIDNLFMFYIFFHF